MGLLLLVWFLVGMCIGDDTNALNWADSAKLLLQVALIRIITEASHNKCLEGVAANIGVFVGFVSSWRLGKELLHSLLLLSGLAVAGLQPALGGLVVVGLLVFLQLGQEGRDAADGRGFAKLRRMVRGLDPSQRRSRREERKQVGGELVGHRARSVAYAKLKMAKGKGADRRGAQKPLN